MSPSPFNPLSLCLWRTNVRKSEWRAGVNAAAPQHNNVSNCIFFNTHICSHWAACFHFLHFFQHSEFAEHICIFSQRQFYPAMPQAHVGAAITLTISVVNYHYFCWQIRFKLIGEARFSPSHMSWQKTTLTSQIMLMFSKPVCLNPLFWFFFFYKNKNKMQLNLHTIHWKQTRC